MENSSTSVIEARTSVYEYALHGPLDAGWAPPGYVGHRKARKRLTWRYRHGVVQYRRPLRKAQIEEYKLLPLTKTDPHNVYMAVDHLFDDMTHVLIRKDVYRLPIGGSRVATVAIDLEKPPHDWYLRVADKSGKEMSYKTYDGLKDVAKALWKFMSDTERDSYLAVFDLGL